MKILGKKWKYRNIVRGNTEVSWRCGTWYCGTGENSKEDNGKLEDGMGRIFVGGRKLYKQNTRVRVYLGKIPSLGIECSIWNVWEVVTAVKSPCINFLSFEHRTCVNSASRLYHNFCYQPRLIPGLRWA